MTQLNQIYKCNVCGNIVEVLHTGAGELVCCGQPMELKEEKTTDPEISIEKHVPVIEKNAEGTTIKVGSVPHPMEDAHYIEWVEVTTSDGKVAKKFLKPGENPQVLYPTHADIVSAREYCNLHGLWKN